MSTARKCQRIARMLTSSKGQGLVEYALILVLIAVVAIIALTNIGQKTNTTFSKIDSAMGP